MSEPTEAAGGADPAHGRQATGSAGEPDPVITDPLAAPPADPDPPAPDDPGDLDGGPDAIDPDADLEPGDHLLGLSPRAFLETRALRGVAMIAVSLVIVLWPDRTDRVLAILVGLGLGSYAVFTAWELLRSKVRAEFARIISVGLASGAAVSLVSSPTDSLRSTTQLAGLLLILAALREPVTMARAREFSVWSASKAVSLALGGALLLAFPETLLAAATSMAAGLLAAGGLVSVFTEPEAGPPREQGDDPMSGARRMRDAVLDWIADRSEEAEQRQTLAEKLYFEGTSARVRFARFATLMAFAAIIASIGVLVESTAVVIGAMLIAPLMVPLMGVALALPMGWPRRLRRAMVVALSGVVIAIATGAVVGSIAPRTIDVSANTEVLARITPTSVDLAIAVAAGAAGAYALGRRDVSDSLPGVAVAIALVPPLAVVGLCWEQGAWTEGNGAFLLFLTNAVAILLAGGVTFVLLGTAPIEAVSKGQERVSTMLAGVVALATVVVLLLLLNGTSLAEAELARADLDNVLVEWTDQHEDWRVIDRRFLDDSTFVFDLAGPGRPPGLNSLLADLERAAGEGATVRVTWIEQQQVQGGGD